ncbi:MAG: histidinol-phosphate transaminase [Desulfobacteraceae bacterium 4572_87]|nr:MAG: histidinol-phosphate transaminase [Desulfobacteraceae bacterium 4572_87]
MLTQRIKRLSPYVPGEQPQDRTYIKLNTNENPYPPTPEIEPFLKSFDIESLRLYPDPLFGPLREAISKRFNIDTSQVFVGNGSDEVLAFAFYAFFDSAGGKLVFPEFSYSFYPVYCDFYGIEYRKIPLNKNFSIEIDAYLGEERSCGMVFPNPNAPTGIVLPLEKIIELLERYPEDRVVVIDEAYIDFGGESAVSLIDRFKNLLIIRTFSKSMSLAALRLGFAMGDQALVRALFAVKDSFNSYPADLIAQKIGEIAIRDTEYYRVITEKIVKSRESLSKQLRDLCWNVLPSGANFIFTKKEGFSGETVYNTLKKEGILVRYFNMEGIKNFVRITIGTDEDMEVLMKSVRTLF